MNWIDDGLAVGDETDITREGWDVLRKANIDLSIDIRNYFTMSKVGNMSDVNPLRKIWKFVDLLVQLTNAGWKIFIYCQAGIDRSPFVAMLYIHRKQELSFADSYKWIIRERPQTHEHWEWVEVVKGNE